MIFLAQLFRRLITLNVSKQKLLGAMFFDNVSPGVIC